MIKAIDFFCGAGGLTRGLLDSGVDVRAGVDVDGGLKETYESNNKPSVFVASDIDDIDIAKLRTSVGIGAEDVTLYAACTPCQPFSTLNQMQGADDRKNLLLSFGRLVETKPSDFIVVENVPGLHTAYGRDVYEKFAATIKRCGYDFVLEKMLDAKDYGVPQIRRRFIMLASRLGPISPPRRSSVTKTVREQISHFPRLAAGERHPTVPNHTARSLSQHHSKLMAAVPKDGGSRSDIHDQSLLLECHKGRPKVHKDVFGRMWWDKPAPTLTCRCTDVYCGRFGHPDQDRGLSMREAAAIQTFPDSYVFHGTSIFHVARQIGNAVPVELAKRIGRAIVRSYKFQKWG